MANDTTTTTVQNIIDGVSQDIRRILASTLGSNDATVLIDYTNRVSLDILRHSRWEFLLSVPQRFITENEITDYWIGDTTSTLIPKTAENTGLNLTDLAIIMDNSVIDRTNFRKLLRTESQPSSSTLSFKDATPRPGKPRVFRHDDATPSVFNIYPAPDNRNTFLPVPVVPIVDTIAGGVLANRIYFVKTTFVDSLGNESTASDSSAKRFVAANNLAIVRAPQPGIVQGTSGVRYDRYNVYASTVLGSEQLQNAAPLAITADFTEPTTGLITGVAPPTNNKLTTLDGYIIEFRYYKNRIALTTSGQILQIPDKFSDIVVAGVNYLASKFIGAEVDIQFWLALYQQGLTKMIRDRNLLPRGGQFIGPDPQTIGGFQPFFDINDRDTIFNLT